MRLKVLSWNIWVDGDVAELERFLRAAAADIVGLQEVQAEAEGRDTIGLMMSLGYRHIFAPVAKMWGDKTWHDGPAVFSKLPIVKTKTYTLAAASNRAVAQADVDAGGTILHAFSTHLIHTHDQPSPIAHAHLQQLLELLPRERTIVMGDFNAPPSHEVVRRMRAEFSDSDPSGAPTWSLNPSGCEVCYPQGVDRRYDYIFVSHDLSTSDPKVESTSASDHLPVSCIVEI